MSSLRKGNSVNYKSHCKQIIKRDYQLNTLCIRITHQAIVKLLEKYGKDAPGYIGEYVKSMKDRM